MKGCWYRPLSGCDYELKLAINCLSCLNRGSLSTIRERMVRRSKCFFWKWASHLVSYNLYSKSSIEYQLILQRINKFCTCHSFTRLSLIILLWNTQHHLLLSNIDSKPYFLIPSHPNHTFSRIRTSINLINLFGTILTGPPNWTTFSTTPTIKNIRRRKLL